MDLLTPELVREFEKIGSQADVSDPIVVAKFFNPAGAGTWYATEYNPETEIFFGYVSIFGDVNDEWGYFSLRELEELRVPLTFSYEGRKYPAGQLGLERDLYFRPQPISKVEPAALPESKERVA